MRPNTMKRVRGRNNNHPNNGGHPPRRSGGNPLSRSYESNGPDVKIRGTAQHIVEKYLQLGRDAQSSGDHVAAEAYFQHAEHYFRILAAAQAQNPQFNYGLSRFSDEAEEFDDDIDTGPQPSTPPAPARGPAPFAGERPQHERPGERFPQERGDQERGAQDRSYPDRNFSNRNFPDRGGPERNGFDRDNDRPFPNGGRRERYERGPRPFAGPGGPGGANGYGGAPQGGSQGGYPAPAHGGFATNGEASTTDASPAGTPNAGHDQPYPSRRERFERGPRPPYQGGHPREGQNFQNPGFQAPGSSSAAASGAAPQGQGYQGSPAPAGPEGGYPPRRERFERGPRPYVPPVAAVVPAAPPPVIEERRPQPPREDEGPAPGLPAFLTNPVRNPEPVPAAPVAPATSAQPAVGEEGEVRRRRRGRPPRVVAGEDAAPAPSVDPAPAAD